MSSTYSGSLNEVSLPKLLYHLFAANVTGRLVINNQVAHKEIYLIHGRPQAVSSNVEADQLGPYLVRVGALSPLQLQSSLAAVSNHQEHLESYLIQQGILSPHDLAEFVQRQLLQMIYEIFSWRVGQYAFYEGENCPDSLSPIKAEPWSIITEGVRQGYQMKELFALLSPYKNHPLLNRKNQHIHPNQLGLHPTEIKLFEAASGQHTLGDVLAGLSTSQQDQARLLAVVYLGLELDLLALGPLAQSQQSMPTKMESTSSNNTKERHGSGSVTGTQPPSQAEQALLDTLNKLKTQDYFQRLGLQRTCSSDEVSRAFIKAARKVHPDHLPPDASERMRSLSAEIFALLNEAQQKLSNQDSRAQYLEALDAGYADEKVDISKIVEAEGVFEKALTMLNARNFPAALQEIEQAIELNPDEGEFHIYRGYTMFMAQPNANASVRKQCTDIILMGLKMRDDRVAKGFLFLGRIEKMAGNQEKAKSMFKKALALQPDEVESARELRLLSMRTNKHKKDSKKGFWRKK